jgi:Leucine-rich repeat (LRR) protein
MKLTSLYSAWRPASVISTVEEHESEALRHVAEWKDGILHLEGLAIKNLPPLPPSLKELYCFNSHITSLPILPPSLKLLHCSGCKNLTELPSRLPDGLEVLHCNDTSIRYLPTILPSSLKILNCVITPIKTLPSLPRSIVELQCSVDQFKSLTDTIPNSLKKITCWTKEGQVGKADLIEYELEISRKEEENRMNRIRLRLSQIKEELIKRAWHTDRVEAWCDPDAFSII